MCIFGCVSSVYLHVYLLIKSHGSRTRSKRCVPHAQRTQEYCPNSILIQCPHQAQQRPSKIRHRDWGAHRDSTSDRQPIHVCSDRHTSDGRSILVGDFEARGHGGFRRTRLQKAPALWCAGRPKHFNTRLQQSNKQIACILECSLSMLECLLSVLECLPSVRWS